MGRSRHSSGEVPDGALHIIRAEQEWICSHMTQENIHYLHDLPMSLNLRRKDCSFILFMPHRIGYLMSYFHLESDKILNTKMMGKGADLYVYAHIHRPFIQYIDSNCIMNIGSLGLPFDPFAKAYYALVDIHKDTFQTSIIRVGYDIQKTIQQFVESDYPNSATMIQF